MTVRMSSHKILYYMVTIFLLFSIFLKNYLNASKIHHHIQRQNLAMNNNFSSASQDHMPFMLVLMREGIRQ